MSDAGGQMQAVVYDAVGARPRLVRLDRPRCPEGGVVVDVAATGVCRSDWHAWRGHETVPLPHVPGHEFAGTVAVVGAGVTSYAVGDRVTAPFVNGCGRCAWCASGQAQVCPDQTQPGFTHPGSFAEQVVVRAAETNLVRLPAGVDFVSAAALGCRFATAYRALTGPGRLVAGEWVAVIGCGGVGLSAVMIAVALGARVVAVDPSAVARARAGELGAEVLLEPAADVRQTVPEGVHLTLDALGSAATAAAGVTALRRHGRHVQVGLMLGPDARAALPWDLVVARELEVRGSHGMAAAGYGPMLDLVARGELRPAALVGQVIGLDEAADALGAMDVAVAGTAGLTVIALTTPPSAAGTSDLFPGTGTG